MQLNKKPLAAVIGALNIDLIIHGLPHFASPGDQVNGQTVYLSPGGKGRNIAAMLSAWLKPGQVSMVGKLVQDRHGLYRIPLHSLTEARIETQYIILDQSRPDNLPTLSIFLNTTDGQRASYYLPGKNESLTPEELDRAQPLFEQLAANRGIVVLSLEMPLRTACHALSLAADLGLRVMLDPGGQPPEEQVDFSPLFEYPIFLIKPNELEAERLMGIKVTDFASARQAASLLLDWGVQHVVITHGKHGAYAFSNTDGFPVPASDFPVPPHAESTGCGDQVLALLCIGALHDKPFRDACQKAVLAGSLQYRQPGLAPILPNNPHFN
jgi:ribokinase